MTQSAFHKQKTTRIQVLSSALMLLLRLSATAQSSQRFLVTIPHVLAAMQNRQLPTEAVHISISAPMTAAVEEPALDVISMTILSSHTAQLKMACKIHTECLPFFISATWPDSSASITIPASLQLSANSNRVAVLTQDSAKVSTDKPQPLISQPATIRSGASATLLMDHERVHLRLRVVYLESGVPGDKVHVATPDHKQSFVAEIVTPTLLKGSF